MADATVVTKMATRHVDGRAREAVAELHGLMVTRTNGMQADKKLREGRGVQNTEDQIEFLCFHAVPIDLRGRTL